MAQQQVEEGGWPLGFQPVNVNLGSISFSTNLLTASPSSSSNFSSDLDTVSTGSFFHDRSITLGNLMGVSSIVEFSRRQRRGDKTLSEVLTSKTKKNSNPKSKHWCFGFCLCQTDNDDVINVSANNIVPLGHFLEEERRVAQEHSRGQHSPLVYGADELTSAQPFRDSSNSLFVDGRIMPPSISTPRSGSNLVRGKRSRGFITSCF